MNGIGRSAGKMSFEPEDPPHHRHIWQVERLSHHSRHFLTPGSASQSTKSVWRRLDQTRGELALLPSYRQSAAFWLIGGLCSPIF